MLTYIEHLPLLPQSNGELGIHITQQTFAFLPAVMLWYSMQHSLEIAGNFMKNVFCQKVSILLEGFLNRRQK